RCGMNPPVRVLIADDSALFAEAIASALEEDGEIEVAGVATDGRWAVELTEALCPDLVLMDVRMPVMDGLSAVEAIMSRRPTPILVMTADPAGRTGELSFEALRRGALELVPKPTGFSGTRSERIELRERIKLLARVRTVRMRSPRRDVHPPAEPAALRGPEPCRRRSSRELRAPSSVVAIGASTGGPLAVLAILSRLPRDFPLPVLLVQHLSRGFCGQFASWLGQASGMPVTIVTQPTRVGPGAVYLAGDAAHMVLGRGGEVLPHPARTRNGHIPSVDTLFESVADAYGDRSLGVLLTGMGSDGAAGLLTRRDRGAIPIAQDAASSVIYGMPRAAKELGAARSILPLSEIPAAICRYAMVEPLLVAEGHR
ncbi:MAG: chemotaxis-specific protein-glutamate methyltransferase CheB, partial [Polyangiaceae bacterium]|nr:chemotaxis-specific protein-glutamate methyltransferase CheB [Polyangiaceae bacterium]